MSAMIRKLRLALVLILCLSLLAACGQPPAETTAGTTAGSTAATTATTTAEKVKISVALWEIDPEFVNRDDAIYKMLSDKFNLEIEPIALTWDDYTQKVNTWVATQDTPDVWNIDVIGTKIFYSWISEELIRPMPQDLSAYPSLKKLFSLADVAGTAVDGTFWCIPHAKADLSGFAWAPACGAYYRKDWAAKLGLEEPTTYDEFVAFVKAMVDGDPDGNNVNDTIGITSYDTGFMQNYLWRAFEPKPFGSWQVEDGKAYRAFNAEHSFDAANAIRTLYNDGLIDPDIAIQDTDAGFVKFATNKAAVVCFQMYQNDHYIFDKFTANNPELKLEDSIGYLKTLPNKYDGKYYFNDMTSYWSEMYISGDVDDTKYERILQLADFCASEEWTDIIRFGLEGVDYERNGEEIVFKTEDGSRPNLLKKYTFLNGFQFFTLWNEGRAFFDYGTNYPYSAQMINEFYDWTVENAERQPQSFAMVMINTPLKESFVDDSGALLAQFIYGRSEGDAKTEWDAMMATLEEAGLSALEEEMTAAAKEAGAIE